MRFPTVQSAIRNSYNPNFIIDFDDLNRIQMVSNHYIPNYNHPNQIVPQGRNWDFFQPIVTNWDRSTQQSAQFLRENSNTDIRNLVENFLSFLNNRNRVPINWNNPQPLRIMIAIFSWRFLEYLNQCNPRIKRMAELICYDQNWTNINKLTDYFLNNKGELYSLSTDEVKPNKVNIKGKVTTIQVLDENTKGNLKTGDIYIGSDNGLYLVHSGNVYEEDNFYGEEVTSIKNFSKDKFYATKKDGNVYLLETYLIGSELKLIGKILPNVKSSDLEKEIKLYYYYDKSNWYMDLNPNLSTWTNSEKKEINLGKINPVENYKKLEFLGDIYSNSKNNKEEQENENKKWGVKVRWGSWIYDGNTGDKYYKPENTYDLSYFMKYKGDRNNKFHDIIDNTKGDISKNKKQYLQSFEDWDGSAHILIDQRFGLTFYWENENYYLKVFGLQYCNWWASSASFDCHIKMGNGIRLYNDDEAIRTKREIFDINNLEEKNQFKNVTKWTDEFTQSINHEQHLPIDNKTNFVTNNITSL